MVTFVNIASPLNPLMLTSPEPATRLLPLPLNVVLLTFKLVMSVASEEGFTLRPAFPFPSSVLLVRSSLGPRAAGQTVAALAARIDPRVPISLTSSLAAMTIDRQLSSQRVFAWVLSLLGGLGTAEAVEEALEFWRSAQIKWPNDVMVSRRKVAGVLAEGRDGAVVLGIGVNVNQMRDQLPEDTRVPAASLGMLDGRERDRRALLADLLARLDAYYTAWLEDGLDAVYHELGARDFLRGRTITVDGETAQPVQIQRDASCSVGSLPSGVN